jgi:hypothetical protein
MQTQQRVVHAVENTNLADILERVLDKGIVIAGDISIKIADIEILTINIRLLIASVDRAKEIGIDWWEGNPFLRSLAWRKEEKRVVTEENAEIQALKKRIEQLENNASSTQNL